MLVLGRKLTHLPKSQESDGRNSSDIIQMLMEVGGESIRNHLALPVCSFFERRAEVNTTTRRGS